MSLLTNPFFNVGMGLLANSGPSLTPVNPYRGIAEGLFNAQQGAQAEQENAYRQWQMEQQRQEAERLSQQRQYAEQLAANAPPELQDFARAYPDVYAKAMAERMTSGPADSVELKTAGELGLSQYDPATPVEVKMSGGRPVDYTVMEAPAPRTDGIKLEKGGQVYTAGSVDEANKMAADGWTYYKPPPTTTISMGAGDVVKPTDAASMVYPDGGAVTPGTSWPEAIAKGARMLTKEEQARMTATGTQEAKDTAAAEKGVNLFQNYKDAFANYQGGWSPAGSAREQAKISRDALVKWYAKNVLGTPGAEPSPSLYDKAEEIIPDFAGPWDAAMFDARMAEIESSINASLGGQPKRQSGGMDGATLVYDPKLKRLVPAK